MIFHVTTEYEEKFEEIARVYPHLFSFRSCVNNEGDWFIEINTLEDVLKLKNAVKQGIIIYNDDCHNHLRIQIDDKWREF